VFTVPALYLRFRNIKIRIYKTVILPVVLCGYETWSLILREEHRLKVFYNRVLKRIFGLKRDEVIGAWRKLHNEQLYNLSSLQNVIGMMTSRMMRLARHVACMETNS
jgi:hypothetical protein